MTEQKLEGLFESARTAEIQTSVEEVTKWLGVATIGAAAGIGIVAKLKLIITKNIITMIVGTLGVVAVTAVVSLGLFAPETESTNKIFSAISTEKSQFNLNAVITEEVVNDETFSMFPDEKVWQNETTEKISEAPLHLAGNKLITPVKEPLTTFSHRPDTLITTEHKTANTDVGLIDVPVQPFSELEINGIFDVVIEQGEVEKVSVQNELIDEIIIENIKGRLILSSHDKKLKNQKSNSSVIYVTVKNLSHLTMNGIGTVTTASLKFPELKIYFNGVGDLNLNMDCKNISLFSYGVGSIELSGKTKTADINSNGAGDMKLNLECDYLSLICSAVGNVDLSGRATKVDMSINGAGDINAYAFLVHDLTIDYSGIGDLFVYAENSISIHSSGVGNVSYKGAVSHEELIFTGIGTIKRAD